MYLHCLLWLHHADRRLVFPTRIAIPILPLVLVRAARGGGTSQQSRGGHAPCLPGRRCNSCRPSSCPKRCGVRGWGGFAGKFICKHTVRVQMCWNPRRTHALLWHLLLTHQAPTLCQPCSAGSAPPAAHRGPGRRGDQPYRPCRHGGGAARADAGSAVGQVMPTATFPCTNACPGH